MIPAVVEFRQMASSLKLFTPASPQEVELWDILEQTYRVSYSFVKRRGKLQDKFMVMEAAQEAVFYMVYLIYTRLEEITTKFPDIEDRHKFYRMSVGFRLKEYFSFRATSSISYLRRRGFKLEQVEISEEMLARPDEATERLIALEAVCRDEFEKLVIAYVEMGNSRELIAEKLGCSLKRVKKALLRVKRRLLHP
jgi:hypothetical protein